MQVFRATTRRNKIVVPLFSSRVAAGFPSPADDYLDRKIDLNEHLIANPAATFLVNVEGESMIEAGITTGDTLIIDKSLVPKNGQIILAVLDGEFTVKKYFTNGKKVMLEPANKNYQAIEINSESDFQIWGVVTFIIHQTKL